VTNPTGVVDAVVCAEAEVKEMQARLMAARREGGRLKLEGFILGVLMGLARIGNRNLDGLETLLEAIFGPSRLHALSVRRFY